VTIHLVRHAKAGSRKAWTGEDALRPLSKAGRTQARAIGKALADAGIGRVVSSPFVRCIETVDPLAARIGRDVERSDALAEGASLTDSLRLVEKFSDTNVALCSHGDVIGDLLHHYARSGVVLDDDRLEKASVWVLDTADGVVRSARYVGPPGS
jgi:broad specificity phosphatase PhoE